MNKMELFNIKIEHSFSLYLLSFLTKKNKKMDEKTNDNG